MRCRALWCLTLACAFSSPGLAEDGDSVTNIRVEQTFKAWPALSVLPSVGIGSSGLHLSVRATTNHLFPGLYTETQLRIGSDFGLFGTPIEESILFPSTHNGSGLRQRVGFIWHGIGVESLPVQHSYSESFTVDIPAVNANGIYASGEIRPFATSTAPVAIVGLGYLHAARFSGKVDYTVREAEHSFESAQDGSWTVEPRVMLNMPGRPLAPGIAVSLVYAPAPILGITVDAAVYYGAGFDPAGLTTQDNYFADVFFEYGIPFDLDPGAILRLLSPASASSPPDSSAEPESDNGIGTATPAGPAEIVSPDSASTVEEE